MSILESIINYSFAWVFLFLQIATGYVVIKLWFHFSVYKKNESLLFKEPIQPLPTRMGKGD